MQDAVSGAGRVREGPYAASLYPAEVHVGLIVEREFAGEQALAAVLATRDVVRSLRPGAVSRNGKYRAFSVSVRVASLAELERLDSELRGVPGVRLLL